MGLFALVELSLPFLDLAPLCSLRGNGIDGMTHGIISFFSWQWPHNVCEGFVVSWSHNSEARRAQRCARCCHGWRHRIAPSPHQSKHFFSQTETVSNLTTSALSHGFEQAGVDVDVYDPSGYSALYLAVANNHESVSPFKFLYPFAPRFFFVGVPSQN